MTKRILATVGLVTTLAIGSAVALAQPQRPGPGFGGPGAGPRRGPGPDLMLRGVDLNDSQREQVRNIMESHRAEFDAAATKLRDAHRGFAEAVETGDEATIRARSTAIAAAMADDAILRSKVRAEVHAILTPEQQEQLKQRRSELEQRRGQRPRRQQ